jgi:hypothetical protein
VEIARANSVERRVNPFDPLQLAVGATIEFIVP